MSPLQSFPFPPMVSCNCTSSHARDFSDLRARLFSTWQPQPTEEMGMCGGKMGLGRCTLQGCQTGPCEEEEGPAAAGNGPIRGPKHEQSNGSPKTYVG